MAIFGGSASEKNGSSAPNNLSVPSVNQPQVNGDTGNTVNQDAQLLFVIYDDGLSHIIHSLSTGLQLRQEPKSRNCCHQQGKVRTNDRPF
jgi:hypothetical protein